MEKMYEITKIVADEPDQNYSTTVFKGGVIKIMPFLEGLINRDDFKICAFVVGLERYTIKADI